MESVKQGEVSSVQKSIEVIEEGSDNKTECILCKSEIPINASLCSDCNSYQRNWRNELKYWAGITGIITLIVTAVTLIVRFGPIAYYTIFKPKIIVAEIDNFGKSAVWNPGYSDLWITTLRISSKQPKNVLQWGIYKTLGPREAFTFKLTEISKEDFHGFMRKLYSGEKVHDYALDLDDTKANEFILKKWHKNKYVVGFHYKDGPEFRQLIEEFPDRLTTVECKIELNYKWSMKGTEETLEIPCVGILRDRDP